MKSEEIKYIPQGYKDSPLGFIPEKWEVKTLGEIFSFKNGINSNKESYGKGIKFVNTLDVLNNNYIYSNILKGSITIDEKQKKEFIVQQGDILFNRTSETKDDVGHSTVFDDDNEVVFGGFIIRAHSFNNLLDIKFKRYCFKPDNIRKQIIAYGNGAIRYNIGQEDIAKVKIAIPPLSEQQKIAEILTVWDNAIDIQTRLIASLQKRKQGLMQQLLTGKKRLEGFCGEWKEVKLGEISTFFSGGTPKTNIKDYYTGTIPFIKSGEINQTVTEQYINEKALENSSAKLVNKGDILYALYGATSGECAISKIDGAINQAILCIRTSENRNFILSILQSNKQHYIDNYLQGGQGNLSAEIVKSYSLKIPSNVEQTAIANILSAADKEIDIAKKKLTSLKGQKKGLMQQLLTGKKRVKIV
jgi:type I restriction enzyme S subunit